MFNCIKCGKTGSFWREECSSCHKKYDKNNLLKERKSMLVLMTVFMIMFMLAALIQPFYWIDFIVDNAGDSSEEYHKLVTKYNKLSLQYDDMAKKCNAEIDKANNEIKKGDEQIRLANKHVLEQTRICRVKIEETVQTCNVEINKCNAQLTASAEQASTLNMLKLLTAFI